MRNHDTQLQEADEMSDDERAVANALGSLRRVSVPTDFNARVRSAIARENNSDASVSWMPWTVMAGIPLVLAITVGGYFAVARWNQPDSPNLAARTENPSTTAAVNSISPSPEIVLTASNSAEPESSTVKPPASRETGNTVTPKTVEVLPRTAAGRPGGGSYVEAVRPERRILPRGIDPDAPQPPKPRDFDQKVRIPVSEVLTMIGVRASFRGSSWMVESVADFSTAGQAGLKTGDVIEAINDQNLTQNTEFRGSFTGKSIRIRRDGKPIVVELIRE